MKRIFKPLIRSGWIFLLLGIIATSVRADLPDFTEMVEELKPVVVNISTVSSKTNVRGQQQVPEIFRRFFGDEMFPQAPQQQRPQQSLGSGFIVSDDGYILTNNHVVQGADKIVVRLLDRRELEAELIGSDPRSDLALLKIDAQDLPKVTMAAADDLKVGEWVLAIGSPFGFDYSVTAGIISAIDRSLPSDNYVPFIQTDVAINPGNSGGPLFNLDGEVVGINSQIYTRSGGFMGVSFAIPMSVALNVVEQLKDKGSVSRGWLGVVIQNVNRELAESFGLDKAAGALVAEVMPESPAEDAGLQAGDIITRFDGKEISLSSDLPHVVGQTKPGDKVPVAIVRNGKSRTIQIKIGQLPEDPQQIAQRNPNEDRVSRLGMTVSDITPQIKQSTGVSEGVAVMRISDGDAKVAGIQPGDIITMINSVTVTNSREFEQVVRDLRAGKAVPVRILRRGRAIFLPLKITN